jgi:hypothetical protein
MDQLEELEVVEVEVVEVEVEVVEVVKMYVKILAHHAAKYNAKYRK